MEKQPENCPQLGHWVKSCSHVLRCTRLSQHTCPVGLLTKPSHVCKTEIWFPVYSYGQALASLGALPMHFIQSKIQVYVHNRTLICGLSQI